MSGHSLLFSRKVSEHIFFGLQISFEVCILIFHPKHLCSKKTGLVSPIYKKGDPQLLDNYRPISTLPIFSKIFEKLIYTRIYDFLVAKNVLYEKQFGFRRNHSTSHAINYSIKYIADKIEQKSMLLESS